MWRGMRLCHRIFWLSQRSVSSEYLSLASLIYARRSAKKQASSTSSLKTWLRTLLSVNRASDTDLSRWWRLKAVKSTIYSWSSFYANDWNVATAASKVGSLRIFPRRESRPDLWPSAEWCPATSLTLTCLIPRSSNGQKLAKTQTLAATAKFWKNAWSTNARISLKSCTSTKSITTAWPTSTAASPVGSFRILPLKQFKKTLSLGSVLREISTSTRAWNALV